MNSTQKQKSPSREMSFPVELHRWRLIENIRTSFREKISKENSPSGSIEPY